MYNHGVDKRYHKRHLPHIQQSYATYFLTFVTENKRVLSAASRSIVLERIKCSADFKALAAVVMPDHVHAIIRPYQLSAKAIPDLSCILKRLKGRTAFEINRLEKSQGQTVWFQETFDKIIRTEKQLECFRTYIRRNALKAGLAKGLEDYPWFWEAKAEYWRE